MTTHPTFTNEDLTAYLDGEADAAVARAIDQAKATSPELRSRLAALHIDPAGVRTAFDAALPLAPALPTVVGDAATARGPTSRPWRALAATALISLAAGWGASHLYTRAKIETWQHYAATYHAMYVRDTLANVQPTQQTTLDELARVSDALGFTLKQTALVQSGHLAFKRAQVLGFDGRPVVQIAFVSNTGVPVALCITRRDDSRTDVSRTSSMLGMSAATWSKGQYQYLLIGGTDATLIAASALAFEKAL
jgi:anti-sigma factor RsiW